MKRTGCIVVAALVGLVVVFGGWATSIYNGLVDRQEQVEASWSEVENQYKRRFDLVPQLVETVQGAAEFEQTVLTDVIEARASVGRVQLPAEMPTDPAQLQAYIQAQAGLSGALGRLFAVAEQYPDLKASQNFLSLQDQLEGTENRIAVARRDFIDHTRDYNAAIRKFPDRIVASFGGFDAAAQFSATEAEQAVPRVEFEFGQDE